MNTVVGALQILIALHQFIDFIIQTIVDNSQAQDRVALKAAIDQARAAKTREEKVLAAQKIRDSFKTFSSPDA